ncbi:MAG TPA: hypothetical protein VGF00_11670 [Acidimicrobiia bacterium]
MSGSPPPPGSQPYQPVARTDGAAIAALVLAIASFVICPVIPAIVALVVASTARRNIAASGGAVQGLGLCQAATIVAWVNIGLFVGGALLAALVLLAR